MSFVDQPRGSGHAQRLVSIDALRGFDMFWIIGGETVVLELWRWGQWPFQDVVKQQLQHAEWEGFHFYDLIFPLFLFLVGVVLPFSLGKLSGPGLARRAAYLRILRRTLLLYALGLIYYGPHGVLDFYFADQRYLGVLQRIAICYGLAALITLHTRVWSQAALLAVILLGYWAILTKIPVPDGVAGDLTPEGNLASYIDQHFLPGRHWTQFYDNEGILSTLPAVGTALLGVLAGHWLRSRYGALTKTIGLTGAGVVCLALGLAWAKFPSPVQFPIIKNLWTSTYVLVAGGWSLLLLALFYGAIDGMELRSWAFFFVVIGSNAIVIYMANRLVNFTEPAKYLFGGLARWGERMGFDQSITFAAGVLALQWLLLYVLYRHRIFLRV